MGEGKSLTFNLIYAPWRVSAGDSERLDKGKRLPFKHGWPDASFDAAAFWP